MISIRFRPPLATAIVAVVLAGFMLAATPQGTLVATATKQTHVGANVLAPTAATIVSGVRVARQGGARFVHGLVATVRGVIDTGASTPLATVGLAFAGAPLPRVDRTRAPPS